MGIDVIRRAIPDAAVETLLTFSVAKTNYAKRPPPLSLRYTDGGVLVPVGASERESAEKIRDESTPQARRKQQSKLAKSTRDAEIDVIVLACVKARPGIGATELRTLVKMKAECGGEAADTAVARVIDGGRLRRTEGKTKEHFVVEDAVEPPPSSAATKVGLNGAAQYSHAVMSLDDV